MRSRKDHNGYVLYSKPIPSRPSLNIHMSESITWSHCAISITPPGSGKYMWTFELPEPSKDNQRPDSDSERATSSFGSASSQGGERRRQAAVIADVKVADIFRPLGKTRANGEGIGSPCMGHIIGTPALVS